MNRLPLSTPVPRKKYSLSSAGRQKMEVPYLSLIHIFNEIARSLVHTKTALGIIPCGSGNGLARHLQIPMEPKKAIDIINDGPVSYTHLTMPSCFTPRIFCTRVMPGFPLPQTQSTTILAID